MGVPIEEGILYKKLRNDHLQDGMSIITLSFSSMLERSDVVTSFAMIYRNEGLICFQKSYFSLKALE